MAGAMLHTGATGKCIHGGTITVVAAGRVMMNGQPAATLVSGYPIAACPFQVPVGAATKPQPCVKVQWGVVALRVKVLGSAVVTQASTGVCQSIEQFPQGAPAMTTVQQRVMAL